MEFKKKKTPNNPKHVELTFPVTSREHSTTECMIKTYILKLICKDFKRMSKFIC